MKIIEKIKDIYWPIVGKIEYILHCLLATRIKLKVYKTWDAFNAYHAISRDVLPHLKNERACECSHPHCVTNLEQWNEIVDKMIYAFEVIVKDDILWECDEVINNKVEEGLDLFRKYFFCLWS